MKRLKFLSLLLVAVSAVALTSCFGDDDDDNGLTPAEIQTAYNAVRGTHSGKLVYIDSLKSNEVTTDTLSAQWTVTSDSTMTFHSVPAKVFASVIADTTISHAVANLSPADINCYIGFISVSPVQWLINPMVVTYSSVYYNGGSHSVTVVFGQNNTWSFGQLATGTTASKQQLQLIAAALYVDGQQRSDGIAYANVARTTRMRPLMFYEN